MNWTETSLLMIYRKYYYKGMGHMLRSATSHYLGKVSVISLGQQQNHVNVFRLCHESPPMTKYSQV